MKIVRLFTCAAIFKFLMNHFEIFMKTLENRLFLILSGFSHRVEIRYIALENVFFSIISQNAREFRAEKSYELRQRVSTSGATRPAEFMANFSKC